MAFRMSTNLMPTLLRFSKNLASELSSTTIMTIIVSIKKVFTLFQKNMTAILLIHLAIFCEKI